GMTGPQLLSRVKAAGIPTEVILMSAFADIATTVSAVKAGAYGFLTKPFPTNESIVIEVLKAAKHRRLCERTELLQRERHDLHEASSTSSVATRGPVGDAVVKLALDELSYEEAKERMLAAFTDAYVDAVWRSTGGNVTEAARRSGLDRSNFRHL